MSKKIDKTKTALLVHGIPEMLANKESRYS